MILQLKKQLYLALLQLSGDQLTSYDIDLMYLLACDVDIQNNIDAQIKHKKTQYCLKEGDNG